MTLQQLRYVVAVADHGSITDAAGVLFISQPSLSAAIRELEKEIELNIFLRTNRGIVATAEGAEFLGYARQVLQQVELLESKYIGDTTRKQHFAVSSHHYAFTAVAFVDLIKQFGGEEYDFTLRETTTHNIIEDVRNFRSEMGVLYLSDFNEQVLMKLLRESGLAFHELFAVAPHVFISKGHPLAARDSVTLEDLEDYPCLSFEQGEYNSFYFSEEILSALNRKKIIRISDRAAVINLVLGVGAYMIATGVYPSYLYGDNIITKPLLVDEMIRVGVVVPRDYVPTRLGAIYWDALKRISAEVEAPRKRAPRKRSGWQGMSDFAEHGGANSIKGQI